MYNMKKPKIQCKNRYTNAMETPTSESTSGKSSTIAGLSVKPREHLAAVARGEDVRLFNSYTDTEDFVFPEFHKMVKIEKLQWARDLQKKIQSGTEELEALKQQKEEYLKEQAELAKAASKTAENEKE